MDEPADRPPTLAADLERRIASDRGDPWRALLDVVARPDFGPGPECLTLQGRWIGSLRLLRILGTGGMGVTYLALDSTGTQVAVKVFGQLDEAAQVRFENECTILRALDHPNIVRYHAHGVQSDVGAFLVMDYVEGTDLDRLLGDLDKGVPLDDVGESITSGIVEGDDPLGTSSYRRRIVRLIATVADALGHVHELGIVHRDVKPPNVIVRSDLSPVLIDFGLGRDLFRELSWTRSGAVVGTVGWMAPEQLDGRLDEIGPRTDLFALGLVLYRALTGRELRRNLHDLARHRRGWLRLRKSDREGIDPGMLGILYGCLEPEPRRRYASAKACASDLRAWIGDGRISRRPPTRLARALREPLGRAVATLLVAATVTLIAWLQWPRSCHVSIMSLEDDQTGTLSYADGTPTSIVLPVSDWLVPLGSELDLIYESKRFPGLRIPIHVDAVREFVRENVLHDTPGMHLDLPDEIPLATGPETGILDFRTRFDTQRFDIDGREIALSTLGADGIDDPSRALLRHGAARVRLACGPHTLAIDDGRGGVRHSEILISRAQVEPANLGVGVLRETDGEVHLEWASVLSTSPNLTDLVLGGCAGRFMEGKAESRSDPIAKLETGQIYADRNTGITPLASDREGTADLTVRFARPMRSLFVAIRVAPNRRPGNSMNLSWRIDDGPWRAWSEPPWRSAGPDDHHYVCNGVAGFDDSLRPIELHGLPAPGIMRLQIRCTMVSLQYEFQTATQRFLEAYVNTPRNPYPCFELVADPSPDPRIAR